MAKKGKKMSKAQQKAAAAKAAREAKKAKDAPATSSIGGIVAPSFLAAKTDSSLNQTMTRDVHVPNYSMSNPGGGQPLLESTDIQLSDAHRYGLIGPNGMGKTTLLRHLASYTIPEFPRHLRILHVKQEFLPSSQDTVREYVMMADEELTHLKEHQKQLQAQLESGKGENDTVKMLAELEIIHDRLEYIDADLAEARAAEILVGLMFTEEMQNTPTSALSGGWRMRVSLACALFVQPDILLLDEPTNHLDLPSVLWLTDYLQGYPKTLVVVSHDRMFLNDVCTDVILLEHRKLKYYKGDYETFLRTREEQRTYHNTMAAKNQAIRTRNEYFISRFKANKKLSSLAQSRQKLLNKMENLSIIKDEQGFKFTFPEPEPLKKKVVAQFVDVTYGYHGEDPTRQSYLYNKVALKLEWGQCIGLVGANGVGKSTLIKMMTDYDMDPIEGRLVTNNSARFGYFSQHHMDSLDPEATPFEYLKSLFPAATHQEVMKQLGQYDLVERAHRSKIKELSGGQKSRIAFARLTWENPHVLIMDEPTNHLDFQTIEALVYAIQHFHGAVILVSHDQYLLNTCCTEYWALADTQVKAFYTFEEAKHHCYRPEAKKVEFRHEQTDEVKEYQAKIAEEQKKQHGDLLERMKDAEQEVKAERAKKDQKKLEPWDENPISFDLLDRWLQADKPPGVILRSVEDCAPNPNKNTIVSLLCKHVFDNYFGCDDHDFLEQWAPLLMHCCPPSHKANQLKMLFMAQGCWFQSWLDKKARAGRKWAVLETFEALYNLEVCPAESFMAWREDNLDKTRGKMQSLKQTRDWLESVDPHNQPEEEFESDEDQDDDNYDASAYL